MDETTVRNSQYLSKDFVDLTQEFKEYLEQIKIKFDNFDANNTNSINWKSFIETEKKQIFGELDLYFEKVWQMIKNLDKDNYSLYQKHFQEVIAPLFEKPSEINKQIYRRPLGYPGDYIVMNYIYDYSGNSKYLGQSSLDKLINNYTCNVPFSRSNIIRKDFFKEKIEEITKKQSGIKILSVGSGSSRELLELLKEGKITNKLSFACLDLEQKALDYVKGQIEELDSKNKESLNISYFHKNILELIKSKELHNLLQNQDLIYASGLFDYLRERFANRLLNELFELLNKGGNLIICNASAENYSHRAFYEFLGDWNMFHRTKEDLLSWTKDFSDISEINFENYTNFTNYLFLNIKKLQ